ncbi:cytochrome P450 [Nocardioides sp. WS12]|uniref:cytochrome P450 n=1 Tax=Nocardioides sp. WS12 TaxID=2486272 RepID=UPI001F358BAC|nr:cytochrome P450 [Nocardioides sp. WS12]
MAAMGDSRVSADAMRPGYPHRGAGTMARWQHTPSLVAMDDPEHRAIRSMVTPAFRVKNVEAMRPGIQALTDKLIDDMLAGPNEADLVAAFALPLPSEVISELLGVPEEYHEFFQELSAVLVNRYSTPEASIEANMKLIDYLETLIESKRENGASDVLSDLARLVSDGRVARRRAAELGAFLLFAGHETTANMIALSAVLLLRNPDQLEILKATDDPKVVASAVEELLRYLTIPHLGRRRVATENLVIGGQEIKAGEGIICAADAANWDPAVFPDPGKLDLLRDARRHVTFSYGVHQCLGQPLARVELQVALTTLFRRIPTLKVDAALDQLSFKHDGNNNGIYELPVTW